MALLIGNDVANYLSSSDIVASYPFAVYIKFRPGSTGIEQCLWSSGVDSNNFVAIKIKSDDLVYFAIRTGGVDSEVTDGFITVSTFQFIEFLFVALSPTERRIYPLGYDIEAAFAIPGAGLDDTNQTISGYTESRIGNSDALGLTFDGEIAEFAVWKDFTGNPFIDPTIGVGSWVAYLSPSIYGPALDSLVSFIPFWSAIDSWVGPTYTPHNAISFGPSPPTWYSGSMPFRAPAVPEGAHLTGDATDTIVLTDTITLPQNVVDTISLEEIVSNSKFQYVTDTISLTDSYGIAPNRTDHVVLMEVITTTMSRERDGEDEVALYETILAIVNGDCPTCCDADEQYHPYIGTTSNPNAPTPPSATAPTLTPSHSVVLSWPAHTTPSLTVTLRAPEFGNTDAQELKKIKRESRGGTLQVFADPQWPKIYRLKMDFAVLSEAKAQEYLAFRAATLGKEVRLVDYESRIWTGVLTDTETPITRAKRGCGLTASLNFEGELL